jgi:Resolvase, N terminal domain
LTSDLVHSRPLTRLPAAQYIRMSTEHQKYSPENQLEAIAAYASLFSMDVVQTYSDLGKSGLKLANRPGLKSLLDDVETRRTGFRVVLVFDVSRWGRFQDADESAADHTYREIPFFWNFIETARRPRQQYLQVADHSPEATFHHLGWAQRSMTTPVLIAKPKTPMNQGSLGQSRCSVLGRYHRGPLLPVPALP